VEWLQLGWADRQVLHARLLRRAAWITVLSSRLLV
jgi:hypothetical protein